MKTATIEQYLPDFKVSPKIIQPSKTQDGNSLLVERSRKERPKASELTLERISTAAEFSALKNEWDEFHLGTQFPSPFLSWDYIDVWWDVYGDKGFDVKMYIARGANGNIVGAAPLMISRKGAFAGARSNFRHLSFLGGVGDQLSESLELPALPGYEVSLGEATAELILREFTGQWDVCYFYQVPKDSRSTNAMLRRLAGAGIGIKTVISEKSPYRPVRGTWDETVKSRSSSTREIISKTFTNPRNKYKHTRLTVGEHIGFENAYEELVRLAELRWGSEAVRAFHTPEFVDFHWKLAPRLLEKGQMMFGIIEIDGQYAGAVYDIIFNNIKWTYQLPWDPVFQHAKVGVTLSLWSVADAYERGLDAVDFLPGESGFKDRWATDHRILNTFEAACPRSMGGTLFSLARGIDRLLKNKPKLNAAQEYESSIL